MWVKFLKQINSSYAFSAKWVPKLERWVAKLRRWAAKQRDGWLSREMGGKVREMAHGWLS
jgi:hypothetical protein